MENSKKHMLGHALLRITVGLLFLVAGIGKLTDPSKVAGMLDGLGFPAAAIFAWVLIIAEVLGGALILIGYKVKYSAWPLIVVLMIATLMVVIPNGGFSSSNLYFHLIGIAGLISIALTGPGSWAASKR